MIPIHDIEPHLARGILIKKFAGSFGSIACPPYKLSRFQGADLETSHAFCQR